MPEINISVSEKTARISDTPIIVCGNSDYTIAFSFDEEWESESEKTARFTCFRNGAALIEDVQFSDNRAHVPIICDTDEITVGVFAGNICTSTPARIPCARCITDGDAVRDPPAVDIYNQLMERLAELRGGEPGGKARLRTWGSAYASGMTWDDAAKFKWQEAGT